MREEQGKTPNSFSNTESIDPLGKRDPVKDYEAKKPVDKDYKAKKRVTSKKHFTRLRDEQRLEIYLLWKGGEGVKKIHKHLEDTYGHFDCPEEYGKELVFNRRNVERQLAALRAGDTNPLTNESLEPFRWDLLPKFDIPLEGTQVFLDLWRNLNTPGGSFFQNPQTSDYLELNWAEARWYWRLVNMETGLTIDDLTILSIVCAYLSGLTHDDESSENGSPRSRGPNSRSRSEPLLDELEDIKVYLAIKPWSSRDAHEHYVDLIKAGNQSEKNLIRLVNFTHWWHIVMYRLGKISDAPPKLIFNQDIPLMWDYPEYAFKPGEDENDIGADFYDWGDDRLNNYHWLAQGITPGEGIALAKMEFALFSTGLIPEDIDELDHFYIGSISFEQFKCRSEKFQGTWDICLPHKYDYSTIADKVFPFIARSYGSGCLWTLLLPLLKSLPEGEQVFNQLSNKNSNIDHVLEYAERFCFREISDPSYSEFLGLSWNGWPRAFKELRSER